MPQKGTIYRILIASPSDCVKERSAIPETIYSWNSVHSFHTGIMLEPVMWETHVIPELGNRPQEIINNQIVDSCDFLIGAFWTRMGTATEEHVSGTAEEIDRLRNQGKKIFLYFSSAPVVPESIDPDQYKALVEYKKSLRGQGITFEYSNIGEFREMLQRHLSSLMASITKENGIAEPEKEGKIENSQIEMFKSQIETFLRKLDARWVSEKDSGPHNIEDAQYIISSSLDDLINYRSQIVSDPENKLLPIFSEATKIMKELGRHQLYMDGGKSFQEFWEKGDAAIELLKKLPLALSN
ncbi:MAG: hypothetical protein FD168_202 [Desulfobulbaceae bacterium]|nr:MAG: hypothetical protein FD168_202 [Desulfobulbaceae bacterium]